MQAIFAFQREADGACAEDYGSHVAEIFRQNPGFYISAANHYYKGDFSCPVWILVNEASTLDGEKIDAILRSHAVKQNTPAIKQFMRRVGEQSKAIREQTPEHYRDCRSTREVPR